MPIQSQARDADRHVVNFTSQLKLVLYHQDAFTNFSIFRTMTANILSAELTALALESKRKLPELRTV